MSGVLGIVLAMSGGGAATDLQMTASPPLLNQSGKQTSFTTAVVTAIVSDADEDVTVEWSIVESDGIGAWSVNSPTSPSTAFHVNISASDGSAATARCTATGTVSGRTGHVDVPLSYTNTLG